jgi:cytochrome P450
MLTTDDNRNADQWTFTDSQLIREALFNPDLSRSFDKRTFAEGNIRERVVSVSHGDDHRQRRRIENSIFRRARLQEYERVLFPAAVDELIPRLIEGGKADLLEFGEVLSVVLAARRAGIDHEPGDLAALRQLVHYVLTFSQGSAIIDTVGDADAVRAEVRAALSEFDEKFFSASYERRIAMIESGPAEPADSSETDVLTLLLRSGGNAALRLDRALILRETATYLQGGTHTSGQTLVNWLDLFARWARQADDRWERMRNDRFFAQRCIQETVRLRPTTPRMKRLAENDTRIGHVAIPRGAVVTLDVYQANIDKAVFGADADEFNPDREIPVGHHPWGLSFGAGPHICIGRTVAAGLPSVSGDLEQHLTGLVTYMAQAIARLGVEPDPERAQLRDDRTARWTRWRSYPVRFTRLDGSTDGRPASLP